jgi:hypothetical protein
MKSFLTLGPLWAGYIPTNRAIWFGAGYKQAGIRFTVARWADTRAAWVERLRYLQFWPVWMMEGGQDCDGCRYGAAHRYPTYYHARKAHERALAWADGPMYQYQISQAEAREVEAYSVDTYAEMDGY